MSKSLIERISGALSEVEEVVEMTYGHDDDGERLEDEGCDSAADVVEALCNVEGSVVEAMVDVETLGTVFDQLFEAAQRMLIDADDRDETTDEETGEEYADWSALRAAVEAAKLVKSGEPVPPAKKTRVLVYVHEELGNVAHDNDPNLDVFIVDADQGADQIPSDWLDLAEQLDIPVDAEEQDEA